jgi:hypothetical protein
MYHSKLKLRFDTNLGAVHSSAIATTWYVGTPDGALWGTDVDPTSGLDIGGHIIPLNKEAKEVSIFGSAVPIGANILGALADDTEAIKAVACARAQERRP